MTRWALAAVVSLLVAGCIARHLTETVYLRQQVVGDAVVKCGPFYYDVASDLERHRARRKLHACIANFEDQGYERVPGP